MKTLLLALAMVAPGAAFAQSAGIPNYYESRECHPSAYHALIGRSLSEASSAVDPGKTVRVFGPGAILTDEFNPYRLNIVSDDGKVVTRVYCG